MKNFKYLYFVPVFLSLIYAGQLQAAGTVNVTSCQNLNQRDTTYILQNNVLSDGTCFSITAANITLDLNGYTVTYDNAVRPTVVNSDFESGSGASADGWDFSAAPNASRAAGTFVQPVSVYSGNYALRFSVPAANQAVKSVSKVSLGPNTMYTVSAMVYNNYDQNGSSRSGNITISVGLDDGTASKTASMKGITWRGFQYIYKTFVTGSQAESYNLSVAISGGAGEPAGQVYVDDVKVQRTRVYGVAVGPQSWMRSSDLLTRYPGVTGDGAAAGATIKNGSIIQGQGLSDYSPAIISESGGGSQYDKTFNNLTIVSKGANSRGIFGNITRGNIHHNNISMESRVISSRDNYDGAVVYLSGSAINIYDNTILRGPQTGIYAPTAAGAVSKNDIYNNTITMQSYFTNDFGITGAGSKIHDNTVNCSGDGNACRGIAAGGTDGEIYRNVITVQELPRSQEYNGCQTGGAYGIQNEIAVNAQIYDNTVIAIAGACNAVGFRFNPQEEGGAGMNNSIHDNYFRAVKQAGAGRAYAMSFSSANQTAGQIYANTFESDQIIFNYSVYGTAALDISINRNTFKKGTGAVSPFYPYYNYYNAPNLKINFVDNVYADTAISQAFHNESVYNANNNISAVGEINLKNTITFKVVDINNTPISGASIKIADAAGIEIFSGTTGNAGEYQAEVLYHSIKNGVRTTQGRYRVDISSGAMFASSTFLADIAKTVTTQLAASAGGQTIVTDVPVPSIDPTPTLPPSAPSVPSSSATGSVSGSGSSASSIGGAGSTPAPACASWTYGSWSTCVSGQQTRTVVSSLPSGCLGGSPVLVQSCSTTAGESIVSTSSVAAAVKIVSPVKADSDGDGLNDDLETALETDPNKADTDSDNFDDYQEIINDYNPRTRSQKLVIDTSLARKLSGRIVLQVENRGQAWYINPVNFRRYYLGRKNDAYDLMRRLSLGVKHGVIVNTVIYPNRLAGRILLDVDDRGKAYYVDPTDLKAQYLGNADSAFALMRKVGKGIATKKLNTIGFGLVR